MSTQRRTGRVPTVAAKRNAASSENFAVGKVSVGAPPPVPAAKKRPPLGNLTNQRRSATSSSNMVPCAATKVVKTKKGYSTSIPNSSGVLNAKPNVIPNSSGNVMPGLLNAKSNVSIPKSSSSAQTDTSDTDTCVDMDISSPPSSSGGLSVSADESISTTDSMKSPEIEYLDENDLAAVNSIQRKTFGDLHITDQIATAGALCKRDILSEIETVDNVVELDVEMEDPQLCASYACDIYKHLRASETKKRPSTDFMEKVQQDINASMRSILIDWLVEVAEEYRLVPDTLYLTVNYIDRYLSGNSVNRQHLQLLGIACMMIASKYEEICAPQVEEYCYITDNTYFKEEVLQMESTVLNYLKFEMTAPTTRCFLRRFVRAAQASNEASPMQLECLANYIAELSLLEYHMLQYAPSIIAASAIFLAKYILAPSKRPWNSTLQHYTLYQPSQLQDCIRALYKLCLNNGHNSTLPAIREKYSQHKYKFVAKKYCPPTIPPDYFYNVSSSSS